MAGSGCEIISFENCSTSGLEKDVLRLMELISNSKISTINFQVAHLALL